MSAGRADLRCGLSHYHLWGAGRFRYRVGCTDFLYAMTTGTSWVMVPETIRFNLHGSLREGVYARDLILTIIGDIGANGANYKIMEFAGDGAIIFPSTSASFSAI